MAIIEVHIKTGTPTTKILKEEGNILTIAVKEPATDNKANIALLKLLHRHYRKPVYIIKGHTSKHKLILIGET